MVQNIPQGEKIENATNNLLEFNHTAIVKYANDIVQWWNKELMQKASTPASVAVVALLTIIMAIPVISLLMMFSVFFTFGKVLAFGVLVDAAIYILRFILGKSFSEQILSRLDKMFPDVALKHYEHEYHDSMREHHEDMVKEKKNRNRHRGEAFYDDEYDDDYDDDYDEEYDDYDEDLDDEYDDEDYDDEEYDDDDYEDDEGYGSREDDHADQCARIYNFDFFAGIEVILDLRRPVGDRVRSIVWKG